MTARALVIGGGSRVAGALRKCYPDAYHFVRRSAQASPVVSDGAEQLIASYEGITAKHMQGYATVITLVGTTRGTPDELMAVNAELPRHFAAEANRAGVAHFVALSSFSVFGGATRIGLDTPLKPSSAYGRSRLAGEEYIARFSDTMACTIARCPILYGAGDSKLEKLISLWCKLGALPAPAAPVHRSMVHYELAARYLDDVSRAIPDRAGLRVDHFADPVTFEYRAAAKILSAATGKPKRVVTFPSVGLRVLSKALPELSRSLFSDSVLDPQCNHFRELSDSRLEQDIARMAGAKRSEA